MMMMNSFEMPFHRRMNTNQRYDLRQSDQNFPLLLSKAATAAIDNSMSKFKTLDDALEDVEARFLYNLPETELLQVDRLFFQLEQAWWFYEDFMADVNDALPHFKQLKTFAERVFSHCPLLSKSNSQFTELFNNFSMYKSQIPVCGCIMLNPEMTKAVLVCTWKGKSWGFPRGKINENEEALDCAIREVYEECGFDTTSLCKEEDQLVVIEESKAIKLFIAANVPENTAFAPQTRKEISDVQFFGLDELPKSTYGVYPFIPKLKRWIAMRQNASKKKNRGGGGGGGVVAPTSRSSPKTILTKSTSGGALQLKVASYYCLAPRLPPCLLPSLRFPWPLSPSSCLPVFMFAPCLIFAHLSILLYFVRAVVYVRGWGVRASTLATPTHSQRGVPGRSTRAGRWRRCSAPTRS